MIGFTLTATIRLYLLPAIFNSLSTAVITHLLEIGVAIQSCRSMRTTEGLQFFNFPQKIKNNVNRWEIMDGLRCGQKIFRDKKMVGGGDMIENRDLP